MPLVQGQGTTLGILTLEALDEQGTIVAEIEVRARENGLDIPALPAVWAVRRLLDRGAELPAGLRSLDQLFAPEEVARWLREEGFEVTEACLRGTNRVNRQDAKSAKKETRKEPNG